MPSEIHNTKPLTPVDTVLGRFIHCLSRCRIMIFVFLQATSLFTLLALVHNNSGSVSAHSHAPVLYLTISNIIILIIITALLWKDYLKPLFDVEAWVQQMRSGELTSKVPIPNQGQLSELAEDLNDFGTMMNNLARDTEQQLARYTEYTEQKTLSLTVLYDVASSINRSRNLSDLLEKFLKTLTSVISAHAGAVRLINQDDQMELVASVGFDDKLKNLEQQIPAQECVCSLKQPFDGFIYQKSLLPCQLRQDHPFFKVKNLGLIVVPLQYQDQTLGVFNLFISSDNYLDTGDYRDLFTSIGKHLGMAIAKSRLDEESQKLSIMQERNRLSYELHDSLAQTLTSIRFQLRVLEDNMRQANETAKWEQMSRIENTIEEANTELRSLIAHFQAPASEQPFIDKLSDLVKHFRIECSITIFFQVSVDKQLRFSDRVQLEVSRIIQEALNNIKKHSEATIARLMIRERDDGKISILLEDDGKGIPTIEEPHKPGEHIGLKSMRERAARIKAEFSLESEPGEGTRLILGIDPGDPLPEDLVSLKNLNE